MVWKIRLLRHRWPHARRLADFAHTGEGLQPQWAMSTLFECNIYCCNQLGSNTPLCAIYWWSFEIGEYKPIRTNPSVIHDGSNHQGLAWPQNLWSTVHVWFQKLQTHVGLWYHERKLQVTALLLEKRMSSVICKFMINKRVERSYTLIHVISHDTNAS